MRTNAHTQTRNTERKNNNDNNSSNRIATSSAEHYGENNDKISPEYLDKVLCKSSEKMEELPNSSIHLVVTSPSYNVGQDLSTEPYRSLLRTVFKDIYRVLVDDGGRVFYGANDNNDNLIASPQVWNPFPVVVATPLRTKPKNTVEGRRAAMDLSNTYNKRLQQLLILYH